MAHWDFCFVGGVWGLNPGWVFWLNQHPHPSPFKMARAEETPHKMGFLQLKKPFFFTSHLLLSLSQCLCPRLSCPVRPSVWRQWHWSVMEGLLHQASCIQLLQPLVAMYPPMSNKITRWIPLSGDLPNVDQKHIKVLCLHISQEKPMFNVQSVILFLFTCYQKAPHHT